MAGEHRQGVGAVLTINGDTTAMKNFLEAIPCAYGQVVANSQVHITLVDYAETAIDIVTDRDLITLSNASQKMIEHLGHLPLRQLVFHPAKGKGELKPFGRFLGVEIGRTPEIEQLRTVLGSIIQEEVGIDILEEKDDNDPRFKPHMSVVEQPKNRKRRANPKGYVPVFPANFHVNGYDVGKRTFSSIERESNLRPFANRPVVLRPRQGFRAIG